MLAIQAVPHQIGDKAGFCQAFSDVLAGLDFVFYYENFHDELSEWQLRNSAGTGP
jgi:hypothetical protein